MTARVRWILSLLFTLAIVGSGALTWGVRTGRLTIFGDAPETVSSSLTVVSDVDLMKGIDAGDHQLTLNPNGLSLIDGAPHGTAVFTVGQREIVALHRIVPFVTSPIPPTSSVAATFAGSPDGVTFNEPSPAQSVTSNHAAATGTPIELGFLIPPESRFVRVVVRLARTSLADQPTLAGFTVNYSQLASNVGGTHDSTVLVNATAANATTDQPLPNAGRPTSLVVTGGPSLLLTGLGTLWLFGLGCIWLSGRRHKPKAPVELGAWELEVAPLGGAKGGHGRGSATG